MEGAKSRILESDRPPVILPNEGLYQFLHGKFLRHGSQLALIDTKSGKELTYSDLACLVERVSHHLHCHGVRRGDVFALCAPNSSTYVIMILALARLGAVSAFISSLSSTDELKHCFSLCEPKFLFTTQSHSDDVTRILPDVPVKVIFVDEDKSVTSLFEPVGDGERAPPIEQMSSDEVCGIMFSSGTGGLPKAVEVKHVGFLAQCLLSQPVNFGVVSGEGCIIYQPMSHVFGTTLMMSLLTVGAYIVIVPRFNLEGYLQLIAKYRIKQMQLVPPVMVRLAKSPLLDQYDISCVTEIVAGAAPVSAELEREVASRLGSQICIRQVLGMTEACSVIAITPPRVQQRPPAPSGSVGTLAPNFQLKVTDITSGQCLGSNQTGEIHLRADHTMRGYTGNPTSTRETIDVDGWLHTGDIGYYDDNGYIFVVDRIKELIKYNAYQVAPADLEGLLLTLPDVADVGVIGVPDKEAGELPHAWVVRKAGSTVTEQEIVGFVAGKVAPYKKLRGGVKFVSEIPKSSSGKILRRLMRDEMRKSANQTVD